MTKMQGKVKAISVTEITEKTQVTWKNKVFTVYRREENDFCRLQLKDFKFPSHLIPVSELKTLVVEYPEIIGIVAGFGGSCPVGEFKQLPLKYSQWQSVIDNGEVDSDKTVEFEIVNDFNVGKSYISYAKIIPQKKKSEILDFYEWYSERNAVTRIQVLNELEKRADIPVVEYPLIQSNFPNARDFSKRELLEWAEKNKYHWGLYNGNIALNYESFIKFVKGE